MKLQLKGLWVWTNLNLLFLYEHVILFKYFGNSVLIFGEPI